MIFQNPKSEIRNPKQIINLKSKIRNRLELLGFDNSILFRISILVFSILVTLFAASLFQSANPHDQTTQKITIPKGVSTHRIQVILEENGILRPESSFVFASRILGISKHIQAGKYRFSPSESLLSVLLRLKSGDIVQPELVRKMVTFPEGTSIYKMGEILRNEKISDPEEFQDLVKEGITQSIRERHWELFKYISSESLEGYLYPDTYWFFEKAQVKDLVEVMLTRFEEVVLPFWEKASKDTKYSLHEIITLASIIEKEAQVPKERTIISSIYHNRMNANMYLAACPTIKYALDKPTKKVYTEQLDIDSPYNTYKNKGLPPGPICNPGIESIKAAVYPAKTNYYYFVAKKDGSHIFSSTWAEHQRARSNPNSILED